MATGKSTWKYNKLLTGRRNYFLPGGDLNPSGLNLKGIGDIQINAPDTLKGIGYSSAKSWFNNDLGKTQLSSAGVEAASKFGPFATMAAKIGQDVASTITMARGEDIVGDANNRIAAINGQQAKPTINDSMDSLITDWGQNTSIKHVTKRDMGFKSFGQGLAENLSSGNVLASTIGNIFRNKVAKKQAARVNSIIDYTNAFNQRSLDNRADNLINNQMSGLLANYAAFGGPIGDWDGAIGYSFMNDWLNNKREEAENKGNYDGLPRLSTFAEGGNIHIKPSKKGTFTAAASKHGMGVQEFASRVLANKEDYSPAMVKKANFAKNASKWKHALGGTLMTHGADWDTGLNYIGNGGSHESNPYEGVPMGVDQEGTPNLVEEGETIWNDYVFSRRLMVPKRFMKKYKLGGKLSFADASLKLAKESEERPNDPISQRGLDALMADLAQTQEEVKARRQQREMGMYALGGKVNKFDGSESSELEKYRANYPGWYNPKVEYLKHFTDIYNGNNAYDSLLTRRAAIYAMREALGIPITLDEDTINGDALRYYDSAETFPGDVKKLREAAEFIYKSNPEYFDKENIDNQDPVDLISGYLFNTILSPENFSGSGWLDSDFRGRSSNPTIVTGDEKLSNAIIDYLIDQAGKKYGKSVSRKTKKDIAEEQKRERQLGEITKAANALPSLKINGLEAFMNLPESLRGIGSSVDLDKIGQITEENTPRTPLTIPSNLGNISYNDRVGINYPSTITPMELTPYVDESEIERQLIENGINYVNDQIARRAGQRGNQGDAPTYNYTTANPISPITPSKLPPSNFRKSIPGSDYISLLAGMPFPQEEMDLLGLNYLRDIEELARQQEIDLGEDNFDVMQALEEITNPQSVYASQQTATPTVTTDTTETVAPTNTTTMANTTTNWTPTTINPYSGVSDYFGFDSKKPFWMTNNGKYTEDYTNWVKNVYSKDINLIKRHLINQFEWYDRANSEQKKTKRYKAIQNFINKNPEWYANRATIQNWNISPELATQLGSLALDTSAGIMHPEDIAREALSSGSNTTTAASAPQPITRHLQKGTGAEIDPKYQYFDKRNDRGESYTDIKNNPYIVLDNGKYTKSTDENGNEVRTYWYDTNPKANITNYVKVNRGTRDNPNWETLPITEGDDWETPLLNEKYYRGKEDIDPVTGAKTYYYSRDEEIPSGKFQDWLRFAPAVGFGIGALATGLSKPDYSSADAILEAARGVGNYQPISFNPIGNYLTYNPFDREFYINQLNAQSGATRRNLLNTSAGNRGTAMAGLLSADYNNLIGIGNLARQAEEYNLAQRQQTEDFNRKTDMFNSEGIFQADVANQRAQMASKEAYLKGTMAAANMRQNIKDQRDANLSANLSGLFQTLGDIGREEYDYRLLDPLIQREVMGRGVAGDWGRKSSGVTINLGAKGGKLKRRKKGFTI